MLTFFKITIFITIFLTTPITGTFQKLAVNFLSKPAQIRHEMQVVKQIAKNNMQRQQQVMKQARIEKVGKPLAEKAIQHGRNKPHIPVVNKHHFKVKDFEKGYIQQIETGDQQMNRIAKEMFESQKNLYELMQEKAALRRAAREEGLKNVQKQEQKVELNQGQQNKPVQQQKPELKLDNKDPIDMIVQNPTRNFNKETYQNFLEQSKKFDKYMRNQYPYFMVKPNMQDYQNFELMSKMSNNIQNTKVYEHVMQNLFKNEKVDLQKIGKQKDQRIISKQDLELLKQNMPKDIVDLKNNQKAIQQFLKQKINITQFFNGNKDLQVNQTQKQLPSVTQNQQKNIQNINNEPKQLQNITQEQTIPTVYDQGQKDIAIKNQENTQLKNINQEQTALVNNIKQETSLANIQKQETSLANMQKQETALTNMQKQETALANMQNENKQIVNIDQNMNNLPVIMKTGNTSLVTQLMQQKGLINFDQGINSLALNPNQSKNLANYDNLNAVNMILNDQKHPAVTFPFQLQQKERESLDIVNLIKNGGLESMTNQPKSQIVQDLLGETNPIQHEIQRNEPMEKMLPNDLSISNEDFRRMVAKHPSLLTTGNTNYFYLYKNYLEKEQKDLKRATQHVIDTSNQPDKEINLYPNYLKDQIRANPQALPEQEFQTFQKKDHFDNMINKKDVSFKPTLNLPKNSLLPMRYMFVTPYQNPLLNVMMYNNIGIYRADNMNGEIKKNLPQQAQEKMKIYKEDFEKFAQDERAYIQLLDLPYYNLMLDLEEKCIEEFELKKCGHLTYELTEIYKSLKRQNRRNFDYIRNQIKNKLYAQDHEIRDVFEYINKGDILKDLTDKFESMHGRLEYLLYDYRLKQI